jgi:hypothetical protein
MAQNYYQRAIDFYQEQLDDKADKLPIFENMYLLSRLIGDTNSEKLYLARLQQLNLSDEHKSYIEYVKAASQREMFEIFGISVK